MSNPSEEQSPHARPPFSGRAPRPPGANARNFGAQSGRSDKIVYLLDPMAVRDLAIALQLKPFRVVADLLELKLFKGPDDSINFETASLIARKHGYRAEKPPPGMLVL